MHLIDCLYRVSFRRYRQLKLPLSCEVGQKRWFLDPQFEGGRDIPDFGHAFSLTSDHVAEYGLLPFSDLGDQLTKKRKKERKKEEEEEEETLVKYKSADILCRAAAEVVCTNFSK